MVQTIRNELETMNLTGLKTQVAHRHPDWLAATMNDLEPTERAIVFRVLPKDTALAVFELLDRDDQRELIEAMSTPEAIEMIEGLDADDRVHVIDPGDRSGLRIRCAPPDREPGPAPRHAPHRRHMPPPSARRRAGGPPPRHR